MAMGDMSYGNSILVAGACILALVILVVTLSVKKRGVLIAATCVAGVLIPLVSFICLAIGTSLVLFAAAVLLLALDLGLLIVKLNAGKRVPVQSQQVPSPSIREISAAAKESPAPPTATPSQATPEYDSDPRVSEAINHGLMLGKKISGWVFFILGGLLFVELATLLFGTCLKIYVNLFFVNTTVKMSFFDVLFANNIVGGDNVGMDLSELFQADPEMLTKFRVAVAFIFLLFLLQLALYVINLAALRRNQDDQPAFQKRTYIHCIATLVFCVYDVIVMQKVYEAVFAQNFRDAEQPGMVVLIVCSVFSLLAIVVALVCKKLLTPAFFKNTVQKRMLTGGTYPTQQNGYPQDIVPPQFSPRTAAPVPPPAPANAPIDFAQLEKLKELLDKGVITQEDYDAKKKSILGL